MEFNPVKEKQATSRTRQEIKTQDRAFRLWRRRVSKTCRWLELESYGQIGLGLFSIRPPSVNGQGRQP